ncbi:TPA: co-chaperone GroES [Candidatus Woesearchaeota archaeon]|nr:co-chaperone GroES [Candidatus Woesearchaeota archaeon]
MNIVPLGERVLLKPRQKEEKTKGGIYIPEAAQEEKKEGIVVAVGTTKEGHPLPLKKGDLVLYGGYSNEDFKIEGEKYLLIEFKDILAKLE